MPELSLTTDYGDFTSDAQVDFNPAPYTYRFSGHGPSIDINRAVGASSGFGPASIDIDVDGAGADPKAVHASGVANLGVGTFPDASVFQGIDKSSREPDRRGRSDQTTEARFELQNGFVWLAPFRFEADRLLMAVEGTANLDGPRDFDLTVAADREAFRSTAWGQTFSTS
jgi:hypothetical protein